MNQVSVKVRGVPDSAAAVHLAEPLVGILVLRRSHGAEPHRYRESKWFELRNHLWRHVPWVETRGRHIERGQQAARVVRRVKIGGDPPLTVVGGAVDDFGLELGPG